MKISAAVRPCDALMPQLELIKRLRDVTMSVQWTAESGMVLGIDGNCSNDSFSFGPIDSSIKC